MWEPVLDGELAVAARRAIREIADSLAAGHGEPCRPADLALFWAYVAGSFDDAESHYDSAMDALVAATPNERHLSLYGGLAGVGWVLAHVSEDGAADHFLDAVDDGLLTILDAPQWDASYDLISGLVGFGVYFLERLEHLDTDKPRRGLARIVEHLYRTREETAGGVSWFTRVELLPEWQRAVSPRGHYNCGVAHGVPGVIGLLGKIAARPDAPPHARELCLAASTWLEAQRLPTRSPGWYPARALRDEVEREATRAAWCYGDPGIAVVRWATALRLETPVDSAIALARHCALRDPEACGVVDPGFCHGAAGLGHLFNRFYQASGEPLFRTAARSWFERALTMRRPEGVAGFAAFTSRFEHQDARWVPATSLLEGAAGIALALLAACESTEPAWDRLFLSDLPPRDQQTAPVPS
ncbi:MAG TPA: lanthionine synthetase C family protein [Kofleriaceae bacterium]